MYLDDIENESAPQVEQYLSKIRVIRKIAHKIIQFLAQIEDFQKKLWLKKKFVVETDYCVTLDRVPEDLWDEILQNESQITEWQELYALDELLEQDGLFNSGLNHDFLRHHSTLAIDTRYFPDHFKYRLLSSLDDLDSAFDGLVIKSENFQALNLLLPRYAEQVKCIYIDPPYNTGSDEFTYKDDYQHACWLGMMMDRLALARETMSDNGAIFVSIDDNESWKLLSALENIFGAGNFVSQFIIQSNPRGRYLGSHVATSHEYLLLFARDEDRLTLEGLPLTEKQLREYRYTDSQGRKYRTLGLRKRGAYSRKEDRPNLHFPIFYSPMSVKIVVDEPEPDMIAIIPRLSDGSLGVWRWSKQKVREDVGSLEVRKVGGRNEYDVFQRDYLPKDQVKTIKPKTIWTDKALNYEKGKELLKHLFGEAVYGYSKPVGLLEKLLAVVGGGDLTVLDFFGGSGTTAHAIVNLNRHDGGKRRYIMVEMGNWFWTVLLPRVKKVVFCDEWKDGKPVPRDGVSHMFKYICLESYEDTMSNLDLKRTEEQQSLLAESDSFRESYMLSYILDVESKGSLSLLNHFCKLKLD